MTQPPWDPFKKTAQDGVSGTREPTCSQVLIASFSLESEVEAEDMSEKGVHFHWVS